MIKVQFPLRSKQQTSSFRQESPAPCRFSKWGQSSPLEAVSSHRINETTVGKLLLEIREIPQKCTCLLRLWSKEMYIIVKAPETENNIALFDIRNRKGTEWKESLVECFNMQHANVYQRLCCIINYAPLGKSVHTPRESRSVLLSLPLLICTWS